MAKYSNLKELSEAFKSGELLRDEWELIVDNDSSCLQWCGDPDLYEEKFKESDELYSGGEGQYDIIEALEALEIPCDNA